MSLCWRFSGMWASKIVAESSLDSSALEKMTVTRPLEAAQILAGAMAVLLPPISRVAVWLVPLLLLTWVVWSSAGRSIVLRRADPQLHSRLGTTMVLQLIRVIVLAASFFLVADLVAVGCIGGGNWPARTRRRPESRSLLCARDCSDGRCICGVGCDQLGAEHGSSAGDASQSRTRGESCRGSTPGAAREASWLRSTW